MKMELANKQSKSILAKLLATENVTVEHGNYQTASFDVKNRVLRLPIWKEMSGSLYDLLVLHEVGHALFTPEQGMHDAKDHGRGFKSFLNVVEDARIERKIKSKYPGGRRAFIEGYSELMKRDFFGINKINMSTLRLIDKINLHYKVGDHVDLTFSDEESVYLDRIDKANTWKDVVKICEDLYEDAKDEESNTDMSDHDWNEDDYDDEEDWDEDYDEDDVNEENDFRDDSKEEREESEETETENECDNGDSSKDKEDENEEEADNENPSTDMGSEGGFESSFSNEPESKTDRNFRDNEADLLSEETKPYRYLNLPNSVDLNKIIIDHKDLYNEYREYMTDENDRGYRGFSEFRVQIEEAYRRFKDFRNKNKKVVEYLAKEFEMKKAADEHARAATANSGILDSERLHTYKYNEHLFKKLTVMPNGKNHGLIMFVDWSGSMHTNMKGTIEQMMILVMFCKRVNIPFEVYAFSDSYLTRRDDDDRWKNNYDHNGYLLGDKIRKYGTVALNRFSLLNLFSSKMKAKELHEAYMYMTCTAGYFSVHHYRYDSDSVYFSIPSSMNLGGTPLNSTLFASFPVIREFVKKNQVQVINSIFLTDGDSHSNNHYWQNDHEVKHFDPRTENCIIRDSVSKKEVKINSKKHRTCVSVTEALIKLQREAFNINIVNFFIVSKMRRWDMVELLIDTKQSDGGDDINEAMRKFRKEKFAVTPEHRGFNEQYTILGGKNLEVRDVQLEVAEGATVAQLSRAFKKFSSGKLQQRKLLSRFIDMIAA